MELNNYFRFEEVDHDITETTGDQEQLEPVVVTSVSSSVPVTSVASSVPVVQPPAVQWNYYTPQPSRYIIVHGCRYYRNAGRQEVSITQPSVLPSAELETDSDEDKSVDLGSQDSTRSGESHEYRKDDDDEDDYIVYV